MLDLELLDSIPGISYDLVHRPGTSNLLTILAVCAESDIQDVARTYASGGHGRLKTDVADAVEGWSEIVVGEN
ncbi:hypothetical protein EDD16DRAFT_1666964 [Pisolithus croceorrhizus]|nr:hypothetical protein EDD16DRAFT_1666964 [Pisolithus croceorrhizus]